MDHVEYELRDDLILTHIYSDVGVYIYLTDKKGNQLARVVLCKGNDLSSIIEEG